MLNPTSKDTFHQCSIFRSAVLTNDKVIAKFYECYTKFSLKIFTFPCNLRRTRQTRGGSGTKKTNSKIDEYSTEFIYEIIEA